MGAFWLSMAMLFLAELSSPSQNRPKKGGGKTMKFLIYNMAPLLTLSINLISTVSYFVIYSNDRIKTCFFRLPLPIQKAYVIFFVAPLFISPFLKQTKFTTPNTIIIFAGILTTIIGLFFIVFSFFKIGVVPSIKKQTGLSTTGTYRIVRHPIYAGTIITQMGLTAANQSLISLLYLPLSIILYYFMASLEEKDLLEIYGTEYANYKNRTKNKIIPFIL